jgi:hypothetical protein
MTAAFSNFSLLSCDPIAGLETIVVIPSSTAYTKAFSLTMWDSKEGLFITLAGTRYGTNDSDVTLVVQQATLQDAPNSAWEDVGSAVDIGTGGTVGVPAAFYTTVSVIPQVVTGSMMPFVRLKLIASAASGMSINKLFRTSKGR